MSLRGTLVATACLLLAAGGSIGSDSIPTQDVLDGLRPVTRIEVDPEAPGGPRITTIELRPQLVEKGPPFVPRGVRPPSKRLVLALERAGKARVTHGLRIAKVETFGDPTALDGFPQEELRILRGALLDLDVTPDVTALVVEFDGKVLRRIARSPDPPRITRLRIEPTRYKGMLGIETVDLPANEISWELDAPPGTLLWVNLEKFSDLVGWFPHKNGLTEDPTARTGSIIIPSEGQFGAIPDRMRLLVTDGFRVVRAHLGSPPPEARDPIPGAARSPAALPAPPGRPGRRP